MDDITFTRGESKGKLTLVAPMFFTTQYIVWWEWTDADGHTHYSTVFRTAERRARRIFDKRVLRLERAGWTRGGGAVGPTPRSA